jgi:hypothetical protein
VSDVVAGRSAGAAAASARAVLAALLTSCGQAVSAPRSWEPGSIARMATPRTRSSTPLGSGRGDQCSASGDPVPAAPAASSNITDIRSVAATPSTMQWWTLESSAQRPSDRPFHHPDLPQRARAIEVLGEHARGHRAQLRLGARSRDRGVAQVVAEFEVTVIDPHRLRHAEEDGLDLLAVARRVVERGGHHRRQVPERGRWALEDAHPADVHRRHVVLDVQEHRVLGAHPVHGGGASARRRTRSSAS